MLARLFFSFADVLKINGLTESIDHGMLLALDKSLVLSANWLNNKCHQ
jgi:hypothetical protein